MNPTDNIVFEGLRFKIQRVWQGSRPRDIMRHPGAAVILPLLDDEHVCLIKNYRIAVEQTLLELPAGTLEPDEPAAVTAARELAEETGYRASSITHLTEYYPSPGVMDERMYVFLATGLTAGEPCREEGEEIENHVVSLAEAKQMIIDGRIVDGKTITALAYYFLFGDPRR